MKIKILPSLLAADFGRLEAEAVKAEVSGADELHLDIMDGHFVPNISFGPDVVRMADKAVKIPLNVHLMLSQPDKYIERFVKAGADTVLIHIESECDVSAALESIMALGARPGITMNPDTDPARLFPVLDKVGIVLCMTVFPGYGGQKFIETVVPGIRVVRNKANSMKLSELDIMVDGGIDLNTCEICAKSGVNCFVAGSSLYRAADMRKDISLMRDICERSFVL